MPSLKGYLVYNAIDFGLSSPSVCLWIAHKITDGSVIVFQEYRQTNTTILELGKAIRSLRGSRSVAGTVIDNDEEKQKLLSSHCGIPSELARKGPGSLMDGIHLIQQALRETEEGRPGLRIYKGLRCNADPELVRQNKPLSLLDEMRLYTFPTQQTGSNGDVPLKGNDHAIDALRYFFFWKYSSHGVLGFGSGGARRTKRL